jgi:glycosidase/chitodextrinase
MVKKCSNVFWSMMLIFSMLWSVAVVPAGQVAAAEVVPEVVTIGEQQQETSSFSWDNVNAYFVLTDRFKDGNSSNNNSYGRPQVDPVGKNIGTFHGGDIKGLTEKLQEGYFTDLGINAIWITAPYEQVHGWVGGGPDGDFAHYAYHGYYPLDFTMMDRNMGTVEEMRQFVDLAHSQGIRIVMDVVMNHAGYGTVKDMEQYGFGARNGLTNSWKPSSGQTWHSYHGLIDYTNAGAWSGWWGNWVRAGISGYTQPGGDDKTMSLAGLPDFRTELTSSVGLAPLLKTKWGQETSGHDQWIVPAASSLRRDLGVAPADYITKWLTSWVEEFGIDGFRVDTAKHVEINRWKQLDNSAETALAKWRQNNPTKPGADWTDNFWMTGEVWGHGVGKSEYFSNGFDSVINFSFQGSNMNSLEGFFADYAAKLNSDPTFNVLSYISSHDTSLYNRSQLVQAGTALLLLPGGIQTFYGDETARPFVGSGTTDKDQGTRSSMNWNSINTSTQSHWQKLGQFRNNHISVGAGSHKKIADSPYTFSRSYEKGDILDKVVVATGAAGTVDVDVSSMFPDGTTVRDAYTQNEVVVSNGKARFTAGNNGVILIENVGVNKKFPILTVSPEGGKFKTETTTVTLSVKNAESGKYTLDGSDPINGVSFTNGTMITMGADMAIDESLTLKLYAINENGEGTASYTFTKSDPNAKLQVFFKKPAGWGTPSLYFYATAPKDNEPTWATSPVMNSAGGDWYVYDFEIAEVASFIFRDNTGKQIPGQNQPGFTREATGWYDGTKWYDNDPRVITKPTAPSNLTVATKTDKTVTLTWTASTDSTGIVGYDVYRNNVIVGSSTATTYKDTGLTAETSYTYKVIAKSQSGGVSDPSNEIMVETKPSDIVIGNIVNIYYKKGFAAPYIHYRIEGGTWTTAPGVKMVESEISGYAMSSIDLGNASATRVEAAFNNGSGQWDSNNQKNYFFNVGDNIYTPGNNSAGTVTAGKPGVVQPGNKVTVYYKEGWSKVNIHYRAEGGVWTAAPGVQMQADTINPGYKKMMIDIGTASRLEACFNNGSNIWDSNGQKNYFFNSGDNIYIPGNNGASGQVKVGEKPVGVDTIAPTVPANLVGNVSSNTPKTVTLSWSASTDNVGVVSYEISRKVGTTTEVIAVNSTTYIDSTIEEGTTYKYQVRARDGGNNFSGYSNEVTVKAQGSVDTVAPSQPSNVRGTPTTSSVRLQWTASTDNVSVEGYEVYRNGVLAGNSTTTNFTDIGLNELTPYNYTVKAFDAKHNLSVESDEITIVTLKGTIITPGGDKPYSTNPTFGQRVSSPMTIDGVNNGEWTDEMLIAIDMAGDDPRTLGSNWALHESPMDLSHLWSTWDDEYLYLAWQYVDVTDIVDPANAGSAGGTPIRSMDMPQTIAIDTIAGVGATHDMWKKNGIQPLWGGLDLPDYQFNIASNMFHSGYISKAVDGVFPVDDAGVNYKTGTAAGITVKFAKGKGYTTLWGVKDTDDVNDPDKLVEFMMLGHDSNRDTFYEARIPLSAIGTPDIENAGIGVMLHQGEFSPVDTIANDPATSDTAGVSESNSPKEWGDIDLLTVPFARIGR